MIADSLVGSVVDLIIVLVGEMPSCSQSEMWPEPTVHPLPRSIENPTVYVEIRPSSIHLV